MQLLEKNTAKCPLCGAKNPTGARRCSTCTRPLENDPLPSQAVYEEALWARKVATKASRQKTNPYVALVALLAIALCANYFFFGYGPSWAHDPKPVPKGNTWKVYRDQPQYIADLPGTPMVEQVAGPAGPLTTATVWVNSHWDKVRDDNTESIGALAEARAQRYAILTTAVGTAPGDIAASADQTLSALAPGVTLAEIDVTEVQDPPSGRQFEVRANSSGWPEASSAGVVRARFIAIDGQVFIAAAFLDGADEVALYDRLVEMFIPTTVASE